MRRVPKSADGGAARHVDLIPSMERTIPDRSASTPTASRFIVALVVCFAALPLLAPGAASAQTEGTLPAEALEWVVVDASVTFVIRNAGLPVEGSFESVEMEVRFDPTAPERGSLSGSVDPSTIKTGIAFRDRHLQGREFFHVARFGDIELRSLEVKRVNDGFEGLFRLRIRDVERNVRIPFTFETDGPVAILAGELTLDRLAYDVGEPSIILSDEVRVSVEASLRSSTSAG